MFGNPRYLLPAILLLCSSCAFAQPSPTAPSRPIIVNVLDRNGNAVKDLTKDSFRVKINKQPVTVLSASYEIAPRRIVVLLDMSGSMGGTSDSKKWKIAREVVEDLLTQTPPEVQIAFLTFTDQVHDVIDFRESRLAISKWLKDGPTQPKNLKGHTAIRDAIIAGLKLLQPFRPGDAIYAITDGGDNSSHISVDRTKAALRESGVRLFAFLFAEYTPTVEEVDSFDSLIEIASDSGGFVFGVPGRRAMDGVFVSPFFLDAVYEYNDRAREKIKVFTQALNVQVNGFYTLQVAAAIKQGKAGKLSMDILDSSGKTRKDVAYTLQKTLSSPGH